jgi:hypothetical protein
MSSQFPRFGSTAKAQTDWWWPLLFLLGLAGLVFWQVKDKDEPEVAGESFAKYYLQNPYLVVDVPIPNNATHVGFLDGSAANRLDLKLLSREYAVKNRLTDKFFVELRNSTRDSTPNLRVWRKVTPLMGVGPNEFRNEQLEWFQDLNASFWEVKGKDERRVSNVSINIPKLSEESLDAELIRDLDIPLLVPVELAELGYPYKFDFNLFVKRVVSAESESAPRWQLMFKPPTRIPAQNRVEVRAKRYTVEAGGLPNQVDPSDPSPSLAINAEVAEFPILETPENGANLFTVEFKRGGVTVGIDATETCADDPALQADCGAIECFIDPLNCTKPNQALSTRRTRKPFLRRV